MIDIVRPKLFSRSLLLMALTLAMAISLRSVAR